LLIVDHDVGDRTMSITLVPWERLKKLTDNVNA